jgi:hypothetical protein
VQVLRVGHPPKGKTVVVLGFIARKSLGGKSGRNLALFESRKEVRHPTFLLIAITVDPVLVQEVPSAWGTRFTWPTRRSREGQRQEQRQGQRQGQRPKQIPRCARDDKLLAFCRERNLQRPLHHIFKYSENMTTKIIELPHKLQR